MVVAPYNAMLAMNIITNYADCVLPVQNDSLFAIAQRLEEI